MGIIEKLRKLVDEFEKYDKELIKSYHKEKFNNVLEKIIQIYKEFFTVLSDQNVLIIEDPVLLEKINRIRQGIRSQDRYNFFNLSILERAIPALIEQFATANDTQHDIHEMLRMGDYRLVHYVEGYFERRKEVIPIILNKPISDDIIEHFYSIIECYCLFQYKAAIIFCRALIEATLYNFLIKSGTYATEPDIIGLKKMIDDARRCFSNNDRKLFDRVCEEDDGVKKTAEKIIHYDRKKRSNEQVVIDKDKAFCLINDTLRFVEMVYNALKVNRIHHKQI